MRTKHDAEGYVPKHDDKFMGLPQSAMDLVAEYRARRCTELRAEIVALHVDHAALAALRQQKAEFVANHSRDAAVYHQQLQDKTEAVRQAQALVSGRYLSALETLLERLSTPVDWRQYVYRCPLCKTTRWYLGSNGETQKDVIARCRQRGYCSYCLRPNQNKKIVKHIKVRNHHLLLVRNKA